MQYFGKAKETANKIIEAFKTGNLPEALAPMFLTFDKTPSQKWSWSNRAITAFAGHTDARGYKQWKQVGRTVKRGQRAMYILGPVIKTIDEMDYATGKRDEKKFVVGFKSIAVFGYDQTEGVALPDRENNARIIDELPLIEVARSWGINVQPRQYDKAGFGGLGAYAPLNIRLAVSNKSTWAHELIHAADDRNGTLTEKGQHLASETVAELGGAILLEILEHHNNSDLGGCFKYIESYAKSQNLSVISACTKVLDRACNAVALALETAHTLAAQEAA